jgi:hypothetical protein
MALKLYSGQNSALKVYATDWKLFARELNKTDREASKQLKKDFREIMKPVQLSVRQEIKSLSSAGPMRGMRHGGRTGWGRNYGSVGSPVSGVKRYPFDSVFVEAFTRPKQGQTGIARLRVRSAATVLGDLATRVRGGGRTKMYKIREFGGPEISRTHEIRPSAVQKMITNFGAISKPSKRKKSRNVYPGFDKSAPAASKEAEKAIDKAVRIVEANIDRNTR